MDSFMVVPKDFLKKLFTAELRPGDPRSAGFLTFWGILAAGDVSNRDTPLRFFRKVMRIVRNRPEKWIENSYPGQKLLEAARSWYPRSKCVELRRSTEIQVLSNWGGRRENALSEICVMDFLRFVAAGFEHSDLAGEGSDIDPPIRGYR